MFAVRLPDGTSQMVPCGHCINCLLDMQSEWATRLSIELRSNLSRPAVFVTLTYNDENLPTEEFNKETGEVYRDPSVCKPHVQQFMRSLRTKINRLKKRGQWSGWQGAIKYFFTSEYGPQGGRPHYHGIIFGLTKKDANLINEVWSKGFTYLGDANDKTIVYCSKYCVKPTEFQSHSNPHRKGYFDNEKWMDEQGIRRKPFRIMSIGLGKSYCEDEKNLRFHFREVFRNNYLRIGKHKKKMPRYFKQKIYTQENFNKYCVHQKAREHFCKTMSDIYKNNIKYGTNFTNNLINHIGRYQYYRHLADAIKDIALSKADPLRDIQTAREREDLLIQNRRKWLRRTGRNHIQ